MFLISHARILRESRQIAVIKMIDGLKREKIRKYPLDSKEKYKQFFFLITKNIDYVNWYIHAFIISLKRNF